MTEEQRDIALIEELRSSEHETPWLEFKLNQGDPDRIGILVSALSNAARLEGKETAYLVWGIDDKAHEVKGTTFDPYGKKVGGQVFEFWLRNKLSPAPVFQFRKVPHPSGKLILLEIPAATMVPIAFDGTPYIRVGSATPALTGDTQRYQALIDKMRPYTWEHGVALNYVIGSDVLGLLDHDSYFDLTGQVAPTDDGQKLEMLKLDRLIQKDVGGRWQILNLGAMLFANDLRQFGGDLERKGVRVVRHEGAKRTSTVTHRQDWKLGYANGFQGLLDYVNGLLPQKEQIGKALRKAHPVFPTLSVRELVANALIHLDMTITGMGPMIELFTDRIEITNPGESLIEPERMMDHPPRSRNEAMASLMRRMGMCEEQGSGLEKVFSDVELHQLPAPLVKVTDTATQVVLFGPRTFVDMSTEERVRACYWHSVLRHKAGNRMTNTSLRERLGIEKHNAAQATGVIRKTLEAGRIKLADEDHPRAGYHPWWA